MLGVASGGLGVQPTLVRWLLRFEVVGCYVADLVGCWMLLDVGSWQLDRK